MAKKSESYREGWRVLIVAIVVIGAMELMAIYKGMNGVILTLVVASIVGLVLNQLPPVQEWLKVIPKH